MLRFFKNNSFIKVFFFLLSILQLNLLVAKESNEVCNTLLEVLEFNTNSYKNCLLKDQKQGFDLDQLNTCKRYFLIEIERLSYVYKNTCK